MVEKILITLDEETVKILNKKANDVDVSRNALVKQIIRAFLGFPSLVSFTEKKENE